MEVCRRVWMAWKLLYQLALDHTFDGLWRTEF
jgi:hypothetical protein